MNAPIPYIGGKSRLAKTIIFMLPEHKTYVEVFCGAAWVFFRKPPSKYEVLNDINGDLICLFRVLQNHLDEFLRQFEWVLSSREQWQDWRSQLKTNGLTDIQRAARYFYLLGMAFRRKPKETTIQAAPNENLTTLVKNRLRRLSAISDRLAGVLIEQIRWQGCLTTFDSVHTVFYLDPPYYKTRDYEHNLDVSDYQEMARLLLDLKGKFILSINDHPEMREVFHGFHLTPVTTQYSAAVGPSTEGRELLITNY